MDVLKRIDRIIFNVIKIITILSFILLTILVSANVFVRFVPVASLHWFDEIVELLFAYLVFYGTAALWIHKEHFGVGDWIGNRIKSNTGYHVYRMVLEVLALLFVTIFFYYSLRLTMLAQDVTNVFAYPKKIPYSCLPVSGAIMVMYSVRNIVVEIRGMKTTEARNNSR
jgi:TRAP-type C4-dicarboxylate transport system permease small subunit